jgi:hypothetical protein
MIRIVLIENSWATGLLLRKQLLEELSLSYDESMRHGYEDWEFNIRLAQTGRTIKIHPGAYITTGFIPIRCWLHPQSRGISFIYPQQHRDNTKNLLQLPVSPRW